MLKVKNILNLLLIFICLLVITGCKKEQINKVNFLVDGEVYKSLDVKNDENINIDDPIKEGHTFIGWYVNDQKVNLPTSFNQNTDVVAKFDINTYTYKFLLDGEIVNEGTLEYNSEIPFPKDITKFDNDGVSYKFIGWDKLDTVIKNDIIFNALFEESLIEYTYTFLNDSGEVISSGVGNYGDEIVYPENPTKLSDKEYNYVFVSWDHSDKVLTSDITFQPIFDGTKIEYTYTFLDADGNIYKTDKGHYLDSIIYPTVNPVKEGNESISYEFTGWDKDDTNLTEDITFTPIYKEVKIIYTYTFLDRHGEVYYTGRGEYNSPITYPENLKEEKDEIYTYVFSSWDKNDTVLTKNITFSPIFDCIKNLYTYKFLDSDGTILKEGTAYYGDTITAPEVPSIEGYEFVGWDKEVTTITSDVIYTAVYKEPVTSLDGLKVSILGDSISTFYKVGSQMNSYYGGENQFYYPTYSATIKTVESTWWYKLITNNNMQLGINNSWSGSCAYGSGSSAGVSDGRINTLDQNGTPDIVIIYLGTNDCASGFSVENFGSAIETIIKKVKALGVSDIFITTLGYSAYTGSSYSDATRVSYNDRLRQIANETGCGIIPLDEYIVPTSYSFYLGDNLHYSAKGAELLSKVYEKHIKEYYGITYDGEIEVEHKEALPEGVIGYLTATTNSTDFWGNYANNIFLAPSNTIISPDFSYRIELTLNKETNQYVITAIHKSGDKVSYNSDYVIIISESYENYRSVLADIEKVTVGCIVEFDTSLTFPVTLTFKESNGTVVTPPIEDDPIIEDIEGKLHVVSYNTGVWTLYDKGAIIYSYDAMGKSDKYTNFYLIALTKNKETGNYDIVYMKDFGVESSFPVCDYYLLIYYELPQISFYQSSSLNTKVIVTGEITSGDCYLEFI